MKPDVLYLSWNRLEFTKLTFTKLLENTEWDLANRLVVYDDDSSDGTLEWLRDQVDRITDLIPVSFHFGRHRGSPVTVMNDYLAGDPAEAFVKVDSDIVVPEGWLGEMVGVMERNPEVDLLGMEAGQMGPPRPGSPSPRTWEPSTHIGGVGLMRSVAFTSRRRMIPYAHFGFTEWQHKNTDVQRGWINPDLAICELGRMPFEPWQSLTAKYVKRRWQRPWWTYDPKWTAPYWDWWFTPDEEAAA